MQIARRLLARDASVGSNSSSAIVGSALQQTLARLSRNLCDSMGEDGCQALLARALARTEPNHPALKTIRPLDDAGVRLDSVVGSVETHGVAATTSAIEALLAALIDMLGRLIGEDMAIRVIDTDHDAPQSRKGGGAQAP